MKTLYNGLQCEILKVFRGQSNNYKAINKNQGLLKLNEKVYADLLLVKFATGKIGVICSTELIN